MSGLLALVSRTGAPVSPDTGRLLLRTLSHRGPNGDDLGADGWAAIGHQHHWTTPEEVGERQPAESADGRLALALEGRIDNRAELAGALDISPPELRTLSDARLVLRCFERWGEHTFHRLLGPFAIIVADRVSRTLVCARDPLGGRTLFHGSARGLLAVASEEQAVLALPGISSELDQRSLAATFAVRERPLHRTFFSAVRELPQGHLLRIGPDEVRAEEYWTWRPHRIRCRSDAEYGERFRALLDDAVRCRLRTTGEPGVLMSGGLDSTSVASVAAEALGPERRLATVSWVFDELTACDERRYMDAVAARWHTRALSFAGDDGWPLRDAPAWPFNPNRPLDNAAWLPAGLEGWRRPDHAAGVLGPLAADSAAAETFHSSRHGVELRHPFRDRRLVEFMLAIPADQLYRDGRFKHVLRTAMEGLLPEPIRRRSTPTTLFPLYRRGLVERESDRIRELLEHPGALWRPYVDRHHLLGAIPAQIEAGRDGAAVLVPWYCSLTELWRARMTHRASAGAACA